MRGVRVERLLRSGDDRPTVDDMTADVTGRSIHGHSDARPHDDSHHLLAAFTLLLFERGVTTIDELSARLTALQVVRGRIEPDSLDRVLADLVGTGLLVSRGAADQPAVAYHLTPAGRAAVNDWVAIMRDRRRLTRTFLAVYDRSDE
jgi:DNA-binding PadR family transcriptional regulator